MAGTLGFAELKRAVRAGTIDTVVVAMVDMQGRLIGKRFHADYFVEAAHRETHACDYLLANDIDMEPVPGYAAASWDKGYGDFVMKPDMATLRVVPEMLKSQGKHTPFAGYELAGRVRYTLVAGNVVYEA